jgi:hypothetical protein
MLRRVASDHFLRLGLDKLNNLAVSGQSANLFRRRCPDMDDPLNPGTTSEMPGKLVNMRILTHVFAPKLAHVSLIIDFTYLTS